MAFSMDTFMEKVRAANASFSRRSSLSALITALGASDTGIYTDTQKEAIQEALAYVPHAKQTRYTTAIAYLRQEVQGLVLAIPCTPSMRLAEFKTRSGIYKGPNNEEVYRDELWYLHVCRLSWQSSNGNLESLRRVGTRESVSYRNAPSSRPFSDLMINTPMTFTQGASTNSGAQKGEHFDDHMTIIPELILRYPIQTGSVVAEQWYQYTTDGTTWKNIPEAAYLIEKGVREVRGVPVYYFKKTNWRPHNPHGFHFEVEYELGEKPEVLPRGIGRNDVMRGPSDKENLNLRDYAYRVVARG